MPGNAANIGKRGLWRAAGWGTAAIMLLAPFVAMQYTDAVAWTAFDFAFLATMLLCIGGTIELTVRITDDKAFRAAVGVALAAAFFLVWLTGAVGIIGGEDDPANLMYGGVLGLAIAGALIARFRPHGMAYAMMATALAQVLVAAVALIAGMGRGTPKWPWDILVLTGFFVALWALSAALFRESAAKNALPGLRA